MKILDVFGASNVEVTFIWCGSIRTKRMKLLNTLILSSLVGGTSAWNWPWSGTRAAGTFNDGVFKGGDIAEEFWVAYGSDCGYIFSFQDEVDE